jgi:hypothetical protein
VTFLIPLHTQPILAQIGMAWFGQDNVRHLALLFREYTNPVMLRKRITIIVDVPDYRGTTADRCYLASIDTFEIGIHLKQDRRSAGRRL